MTMYRGNKPSSKDGWIEMDAFTDRDNIEWLVYQQPQRKNGEWVNYKIVANGFALNKANYWFAHNFDENKFAFKRDLNSMNKNRDDLYLFIIRLLEG